MLGCEGQGNQMVRGALIPTPSHEMTKFLMPVLWAEESPNDCLK